MKITLKNKIIPNKESTQFLDLDKRLNWEEHIDIVRAKTKTVINTHQSDSSKKWKEIVEP